MTKENHYILNYIDDFLIFGHKEKCHQGFERLHVLLEQLGFTISHHKTVSPSQKVVCLGISIDTTTFTTSIPPEKLHKIVSLFSK